MSAQMHVAQQTLQRVENMENRAVDVEQLPPYSAGNYHYPTQLPVCYPQTADQGTPTPPHSICLPKVLVPLDSSHKQSPKTRNFLRRKTHRPLPTPIYELPAVELPGNMTSARMVHSMAER